MSSAPNVNPAPRIASSGLEFCSEDNADVGFMISSMPTKVEPRKYLTELVQTSNLSPGQSNPKNVTFCLQAQSPRVDHNRDRKVCAEAANVLAVRIRDRCFGQTGRFTAIVDPVILGPTVLSSERAEGRS